MRIRVLHALIEAGEEVDILRGLPEWSRLSPTLFGICAAELIHELRTKFPELKFADITSIDNCNWIGAFLYVDDMVLIARLATQLQHMIDACQEWSERSGMKINNDKTKIMVFYETPAQRASRQPSLFWLTPRFPHLPQDQLGLPNSFRNRAQSQARHPSQFTRYTDKPTTSVPHLAVMRPLTRNPKPQIPPPPHPGSTSPKCPSKLSPAHLTLLRGSADHHA